MGVEEFYNLTLGIQEVVDLLTYSVLVRILLLLPVDVGAVIMRKVLAVFAAAMSVSVPALSGVVLGGSLLSGSAADQLETWLGVGDQDFTNIWSGGTGATSTSWHSAVDGVGPTFSIYDVTYNGNRLLLGGYTALNWAGDGYASDSTAFVFSLTTTTKAAVTSAASRSQYAVYRNITYFATFGGGHDLFGGLNSLGQQLGYAYPGYSYGSFNQGQLLGTPGEFGSFVVNRLETYTIAAAVENPVPEPSTVTLLGASLLAFGAARRRRTKCD